MFFDRFQSLCEEKGISVYKACTDIGLNRSAVAKWKAGGKPNGNTAAKLAEYLGVTTDYLLTGQEETRPNVTDDDIKFALFGGAKVTDAQFEEVKRFARYIAENNIKPRD